MAEEPGDVLVTPAGAPHRPPTPPSPSPSSDAKEESSEDEESAAEFLSFNGALAQQFEPNLKTTTGSIPKLKKDMNIAFRFDRLGLLIGRIRRRNTTNPALYKWDVQYRGDRGATPQSLAEDTRLTGALNSVDSAPAGSWVVVKRRRRR